MLAEPRGCVDVLLVWWFASKRHIVRHCFIVMIPTARQALAYKCIIVMRRHVRNVCRRVQCRCPSQKQPHRSVQRWMGIMTTGGNTVPTIQRSKPKLPRFLNCFVLVRMILKNNFKLTFMKRIADLVAQMATKRKKQHGKLKWWQQGGAPGPLWD